MAFGRKRRRSGRFSDYVSVFTLFAILAVAAAWFEHHNAESLSGEFRVVDGDSLAQGDRKLRLVGIDAPEFDQTCDRNGQNYACGTASRAHLRSLVTGESIICQSEGRDKYDRLLVECFNGKESLNAAMVAAGWAISYGRFQRSERVAQAAGVGLWAGNFDRPDAWRARYGGLLEGEHGSILRKIYQAVAGWF